MKKKKSSIGILISVVLAIAAISMIALKLYRKLCLKKQEAIDDADETDDLIETPTNAEEVPTEEPEPTAAEEQA